MDYKELIKRVETRQVKVVFKNTTNDQNTLFGGTAMQWMDEVAYITATRFCRKKVVTISADTIMFKKPIPFGCIVELIGKVENVGVMKLKIIVEIYLEQKYSTERELAVEGNFYFAAISDDNKPLKILA